MKVTSLPRAESGSRQGQDSVAAHFKVIRVRSRFKVERETGRSRNSRWSRWQFEGSSFKVVFFLGGGGGGSRSRRTCVSSYVSLQEPRPREGLAAVRTLAALAVRAHVHRKRRYGHVDLVAVRTPARLQSETTISLLLLSLSTTTSAEKRFTKVHQKGFVEGFKKLDGHFLAKCILRRNWVG